MLKMKKTMRNFTMVIFVYAAYLLIAIASGLLFGTLLATIVYTIIAATTNPIFGAFGIAAILLVTVATTKVCKYFDMWDMNEILNLMLED